MRWFFIGGLILICLILAGCSLFSKQIIYQFNNSEFVFDETIIEMGSKKIEQKETITLYTFEISPYKKEPLNIRFIFSGFTPKIKTLESISFQLMRKDATGKLEKVDNIELKEFAAEYITAGRFVKLNLNNSNVYQQINWSEVEYSPNLKNNSVQFTGKFLSKITPYPNELVLKFKMKWQDREKEFEMVLTKSEYKGRKFNPKF